MAIHVEGRSCYSVKFCNTIIEWELSNVFNKTMFCNMVLLAQDNVTTHDHVRYMYVYGIKFP